MKDEYFSGLTARFKLDKIEDIPATLTLTANVSFWKEASKRLANTDGFGVWQIKAAINSLVRQAEESFYHRVPGDHE